ncbi:transposase [Paenibacillus wynnii]|nr:transposase [Paenibacillus wynnii]
MLASDPDFGTQKRVHKAYKYRIYPTKEQQQLIHQMFGCCRFVFNHFLGLWNNTYATTGKGLSYNTCATQLPTLKGQFDWLKTVDSIALQSAVRHVADSFDRFFKKQNQAPRNRPTATLQLKKTNLSSEARLGSVCQLQSLRGTYPFCHRATKCGW